MIEPSDSVLTKLSSAVEKIQSATSAVQRWTADPARFRRDMRDAEWRKARDPRIATWHAQIKRAQSAEDWPLVRQLITSMLQVTGTADGPEVRQQLILSLVNMGQSALAEEHVRKAVARYPDSALLRKTAAELWMAQQEYTAAMRDWDQFFIKSQESEPDRTRVPALHPTGTTFQFSPMNWLTCVDQWLSDIHPSLWSVALYRGMMRTLKRLGEPTLASRVAVIASDAYPDDQMLARETLHLLSHGVQPGGVPALASKLTDVDAPASVKSLIDDLAPAETLISDLRRLGPPGKDELRVLNAFQHTGTAQMVVANDYWDEHRISQRALELAVRDRWPEQRAATDILTQAAWDEATRFGKTHASSIRARPSVVAEASLHFFKQELVQRIPAQRIAEDIAATHKGDPIFVDLPSVRIPFLAGYTAGHMQAIYLYTALRELGCNVCLVRFPQLSRPQRAGAFHKKVPARPVSMPTLRFVTQPAGLKPPTRKMQPVSGHPAAILVPSGIRSVATVLERLPQPFVVNSGSAIKGLAYERSQPQEWGYTPNVSLHTRNPDLLPTIKIPTTQAYSWRRAGGKIRGSALTAYSNENVEAVLSTGTLDTSDWHQWAATALLPYFKDYSRRARNFVEKHNIRRIEIGDYLYAEPSLLAAQVRARGGRVNIWPHSTNPVHVEYHNPANIHTIRAVTKSGAEAWRTRMPRKRVVHAPDLMLHLDSQPVQFSEGQPVSVVVIGGRALMGDLPIMDIAAHHKLYQDFFHGMSELVDDRLARLYFKPRGMTGEHELWLRNTIGSRCPWEPVLDHPSKIQLPNPVYVSLTVGSSALFEGAVRGIPGIIVAGGAARDYLDPSGSVFPRQSLTSALAAIESTAGASGWSAAQQEQLRRLKAEIHRA